MGGICKIPRPMLLGNRRWPSFKRLSTETRWTLTCLISLARADHDKNFGYSFTLPPFLYLTPEKKPQTLAPILLCLNDAVPRHRDPFNCNLQRRRQLYQNMWHLRHAAYVSACTEIGECLDKRGRRNCIARGPCDGLIPRPGESYRVCVTECDQMQQ